MVWGLFRFISLQSTFSPLVQAGTQGKHPPDPHPMWPPSSRGAKARKGLCSPTPICLGERQADLQQAQKVKLQDFWKDPRDVGDGVTLQFRGQCAVDSPHVPLKSQSSVFIYCLWTCIPLNCKSREWVITASEKSVLATWRQPPIWVEGSNLLSIRWSVNQRGLTEQ